MSGQSTAARITAVTAAAAMLAAGSAFVGGQSTQQATPTAQVVSLPSAQPAPSVALAVEPAAAVEDDDVSEVSPVSIDAADRALLAEELSTWVTRHPRQLVEVIADLAEKQVLPVPATYLLSIAWSETRGKILAVSPAGAAGLAQATPAAYLSEDFDGKLFVTADYLMGSRAYIIKKPLGDALAISEPLMKKNTAAARKRAKTLTARAIELRREGFDELEALRPVANTTFFRRIAEGDAHNLATLQELQRIIDRGAPGAEVKRFRARVQKDYTYLRNMQRTRWEKYARDLSARRDTLLRSKFGQKPATVITTRPYEAGKYLGEVLDARFSPVHMAEFLAAHLETKQEQARDLGVADEKLHAWTAALYNGGAVNIKRMQAGLIGTLTETQKYMKAVPARMARLERALG